METTSTSNAPVYIVDDHTDDQKIIREAFQEIFPSVTVQFFSNGIELILQLEKKARQLPRFIMMELKMPLMCGIETLKWIRHNKNYKNLPVIMLSSSSNERDINLCYQLGANSYLIKPCKAGLYVNIIEGLKRYWIQA